MNPGDDCDAAETQREEDAERDDPRAKLRGHAEAAEDEQKQEQVVERQRALDHVDGGHSPAAPPVAAIPAVTATAGENQPRLHASASPLLGSR
jgi:hypothetical protein